MTVLALALAWSGGSPATSWAQDNSDGECAVNGESENTDCAAPQPPELDWIPIDQVPPELRDRQCINCQGRYFDPLQNEDTSEEPSISEINARADSTELRENEAVFSGRVQAQQGYRHLSGDQATLYRDTKSAVLTGNVTLREPGVLLTGERAEVFSQTGEATVEKGQFVFHERHMRGSADDLARDEEGFVYIDDGSLSYCAPGENDWAVRADELKLDFDEGLATAKDAKIDVKGVPIFYTPYLQFPLDDRRRTGFLWPHFGNDSTGGLDITVPVYFNLAPNYDALYSPRLIEERGVNHELLLRYLNPLVGTWAVGGSWIGDDDKYAEGVSDDSTDRWLGIVRHNGLFNQRWRSRVDYSKASDVDYIADLETSSLESQRQTNLLQLAKLDYLGDSWLMNLELRQFQSLADDINEDYQTLPEFTAQYRGGGELFSLQPVFLTQASNFDSDEDRVTGRRLYTEAGVTYPMRWLAGFLRPTVKYRQVEYDLSDTNAVFSQDSPSAGSALASVDGGLIFERKTSFRQTNFLQTLEPRLYYLYSEYEEQRDQPDFDSAELTFSYNQLFRETRFSGHDRLDDANQVALGLTTNFVDERNGANLLSASIGQIYHFRDRKVRLSPTAEALDDSGSEIAGELTVNPNKKIRVRSSLVYDPFEEKMNSGHINTSYFAENGGIYNIGYSYRRPLTTISSALIDQPATAEASVSAYIPVGNSWSVFGAMNYSTQANQSVEDMVGVEYDSCCWTVRMLYLRYYNNESGEFTDFDDPNLERESTAQFQIILKGMGGFGDRITNVMQDMIRGFNEREY